MPLVQVKALPKLENKLQLHLLFSNPPGHSIFSYQWPLHSCCFLSRLTHPLGHLIMGATISDSHSFSKTTITEPSSSMKVRQSRFFILNWHQKHLEILWNHGFLIEKVWCGTWVPYDPQVMLMVLIWAPLFECLCSHRLSVSYTAKRWKIFGYASLPHWEKGHLSIPRKWQKTKQTKTTMHCIHEKYGRNFCGHSLELFNCFSPGSRSYALSFSLY